MADDQPNQNWKPRYNPWLIAVVVAMAAFMEVLDTSIANVALPHISGDLGASQDESTWVLTTYLVANAVVLPITGWLSSLLGRKRFFMICIALFTLASLFCGAAPTLPALLCFLAIQDVYKRQDHKSERQIDEVDPAPGVVIGDPAAQDRSQGGSHDHRHAEQSKGCLLYTSVV